MKRNQPTQEDRMTNQQAMIEQLEAMIDTDGLQEVLDTLGIICQEKAEHIQASYQDTSLSEVWRKVADRLDRAATMANLLPQ